jgi:hypothetical protein
LQSNKRETTWAPASFIHVRGWNAVFFRKLIQSISGLFQRYRYILLGIFFFISSCAGTHVFDIYENCYIIDQVPFYPQEAFQCGPASIAGVLSYWNIDISPEEIAAEIYSKSAKGTLDVDMVRYAERKGLKVRQYRGSIEDIRLNIDSGNPIIVLVDYGFWIYQRNHFMVIAGYFEDGIVANTGRDHLKFIFYKDFLSSWKRTNYWILLITPKN